MDGNTINRDILGLNYDLSLMAETYGIHQDSFIIRLLTSIDSLISGSSL